MKEGCGALKYTCFQPEIRNAMLESCTDDSIRKHLHDLYDLIFYQMKEMDQQRAKIIAMQHNNAWKQYDTQTVQKTNCSKKCGGC